MEEEVSGDEKYYLTVSIVLYKKKISDIKKILSNLYLSCDFINKKYKIYLINNSFDKIYDYSAEFVQDSRILWINSDYNLGYGKGNNKVIKLGIGKFHLVLNPDIILKKETILENIKYLDQNIDVGLVYPSIFNQFGKPQVSIYSYPSILILLLRGFAPKIKKNFKIYSKKYEFNFIDNNVPEKITFVSGCYMLFRKSDFLHLNGFDERFFLYFEDTDIALRLSKIKKIKYSSKVNLIHYGGGVTRKNIIHIFYFFSSLVKFYNKHYWKLI